MEDYDVYGIIIIGIIIVFVIVVYTTAFDPWMVSNEVKDKIEIVEPYDDYKSIFCLYDSHNWWDVLISVIDIESGNSSYSSLKYNRGTGELKGTFDGVELR